MKKIKLCGGNKSCCPSVFEKDGMIHIEDDHDNEVKMTKEAFSSLQELDVSVELDW